MSNSATTKPPTKAGPGRPKVKKPKEKLSVTVPPEIVKAATKAAKRNRESRSKFVTRAISNELAK